MDAEWRKAETELQQLQSERNRLSKEIGGKKSRDEATEDLEASVRKIGDQIVDLNARTNLLDGEERDLLPISLTSTRQGGGDNSESEEQC